MNNQKNLLFFFYGLAFLVLACIILYIFFIGSHHSIKNPSIQPVETVTSFPSQGTNNINPPSFKSIPTTPPSQGGGISENSPILLASKAEIQKIYLYLPYKIDYQLSTGISVSVIIPGRDLQLNPWSLTVQIENINYNTSSTQPDYEQMKASFIQAAGNVFGWIEQRELIQKKFSLFGLIRNTHKSKQKAG